MSRRAGRRCETKRLVGWKRPSPRGGRLRLGGARESHLGVGALRFWISLGVALLYPRRRSGKLASFVCASCDFLCACMRVLPFACAGMRIFYPLFTPPSRPIVCIIL